MGKRYDIAIIGSGPAGLEAAINAKIRNKDIIIFGNKELSSKLVKAPKINNYLGFYNVSGNELKDKFVDHIDKMGIEITFERINNVYAMGEYFALMVNEKMYEAKTVILSTGVEYGKALKGEEELLGKGVGYCATCDAPLYKNKTVAIIGYNKEAEEEANFVGELASKLYYIPMYKSDYELSEKVEVINDKPIEIVGEQHVEKLLLKDSQIKADGIFVLKDSVSPSQLVPGLEMEDEHIKVDRKMQTNISGCFAAGDCTGKPYQYIKSAGEGQIAALSAVSYLDKQSS
ncbi:NAD(P)/FAD-dependent oxidoreductase [Clostridium botulinum]|uniref:Pyridine nucleotide-disulfide oxidoreductase n=1 Tax=Clostridium botulinum B str. Osaka05 TaxID=1407017 RepID=A0A0S6UB57_CLOBO|nr:MULTISPECIES: NAD(P)/FAD-dependent oxidoreductase [Clostridium]AVQ45091.1 NAD(P)/FAD-dependent oxidoreductase [Clostridium botulinum]AVQ48685.1 NAD(P)/FAD-dependent oxidoreductase [Clostridium botulinum]EKO1913994.1 NAD(P)/FAD-dependent oxidoreductase [Clostridium botulinum]EKO2044049.1 NAD(P)/FAD-dependent oxidoreductase [Clostridium botulinum]MBO0524669.1 NAD(P)/FAD-dependent oxidoreductase [Clostridium botulinum]